MFDFLALWIGRIVILSGGVCLAAYLALWFVDGALTACLKHFRMWKTFIAFIYELRKKKICEDETKGVYDDLKS